MKKFMLLMIFLMSYLLFNPLTVYALNPVLFFSDLVDGPKTGLGDGLGSGAIVTIWGTNLGSFQGTSTVKVGGVTAAYVYYWGNADGSKAAGPAELFKYQRMQTISFSIPATAVDGANTISITVGGVTSNTLPFTVRTGNIYYVATTGSDSNPGTWSKPWATMNYGVDGGISGKPQGSIVYVTDGVISQLGSPIGVGRYYGPFNGTSINHYALVAYPGASAKAYGASDYTTSPIYDYYYNNYWVISKITAIGGQGIIGPGPHWRVVAMEATGDPNYCPHGLNGGISWSGPKANDIKVYGVYTHNYGGTCTNGQQHTWYLTVRNSTQTNLQPFDLGWNHFENNLADSALHVYDETGCGTWANGNLLHDNVTVNVVGPGISIGFACYSTAPQNTESFYIYNNLFINTGTANNPGNTGHCEAVHFGGANPSSGETLFQGKVYFYNNVQYGYGDTAYCTNSSDFLGLTWVDPTAIIDWRNNIVVDTKNFPFLYVNNNSVPTGHTNNLWYSGSAQKIPSWDTSPITSNPLFVDITNGFFNLQSGSPAIKAGFNVFSLSPPIATADIYGVTRGTQPSIGAFEFVNTVRPSSPIPTGLILK